VAPQVRERQGHWMQITDHADGSITARFGVATLDWVTGWVLSYGSMARVLEPPELIARVRETAEGALRRYAETVTSPSQRARDFQEGFLPLIAETGSTASLYEDDTA
jgi:hypothetical protein